VIGPGSHQTNYAAARPEPVLRTGATPGRRHATVFTPVRWNRLDEAPNRKPGQETNSGLTVRCFRDDRRPDGWCPARVARPVSAAISGPAGCPAAARTPAISADTGGPCGSHLGHGNRSGARPDTGPQPLLPQATAASKRGGHGLCPVGMATPTAHAGTGVDCRRHRRDSTAVAVRRAVQVPDTRGRTAASGLCPAAAVARGTGRRVGGRCWDAASAGGCGRAGRSAGRGAGRGRRSWLVG
jgi:hypothetical protein